LCDLEWSQEPIGETETFGGDVMVRVSAVREVGGYNAAVIAGEDPDFAWRVRQRGHRILRVDAEMTRHDAALTRFGQWWVRTKRSGYAYAQVAALHAETPERFWARENQRALFWGMVVPMAVPALALPTLGLSSLLLGVYPLRAARVARRAEQRGLTPADARRWAMHCIGASFPQAAGILQYHSERLRGKVPTLIEYK
jgi:GT2 family glycosyltransferase